MLEIPCACEHASGEQDFTIAAVVLNFYNQGLAVQGNWQDMRRYFKTSEAGAYLVKLADGYGVTEVQQRIQDTYADRENLSIASNQSLINQVLTLLNQAYSMFDVMAIIALLVGALGVVNTLTMNVLERAQEIGMLRSIGLTRGQTMVMVLAEVSADGFNWWGAWLGLRHPADAHLPVVDDCHVGL